MDLLLKAIVNLLPSANEVCAEKPIEGSYEIDETKPLAAYIFKTVADPFVGKLSFVKVLQGKLSSGIEVNNMTTGESEKIGKLVFLRGKSKKMLR